MSRRKLTSNKRSFRKNPKTFLDQISKAPISIQVDDGVNPVYTVKVSPVTAAVLNSEDIPGGVSIDTTRDFRESIDDLEPL